MLHLFTRATRLLQVGTVCLLFLFSGTGQAKPPAIIVHQTNPTDAEELSIAINPADPSILAAGANINYHFRSTDGGASWEEYRLSSSLGVAGDPCVVFDADGNLYYSHLSYPQGGSWLDRIVVQKSTDTGLTWSDGASVGLNPPKDQDKSIMTADLTDTMFRNNLYVAWTEFDTYGSSAPDDSTRILFSRSVNQGLSWSQPVRISERGGNCLDGDDTVEGATPAVGPEGQVYLAWSGHEQIYFDRSFNGGVTFGQDVIVTDQPGGWNFSVPGIYRCNGMPVTVCDRSHSPYRGRVYVVFSDQRNGTDDTDVFLCFSDDQGLTWSPPRRINDDSGATHQFFPWATVDPVTGTVAIVFYDRRNASDNATEVTVAVSHDGGATFTNQIVSNFPFVPWSSIFFGDYIGIDARAGNIYAIWMSLDQGELGVWMAKLSFPSGAPHDFRPRAETTLLMNTATAPTSSRTKISFTTYQDAEVRLAIFDLRGSLIKSLVSERRTAGQYTEMWDGRSRSGTRVASGMYVVRLEAGQDVVTRKVTLVN
jgi:hypothetical protein